eukprot:GFUD01003846.1.p1 GENE.GFUD01003846.1~~GFUD01003846.1.p1  ORF type:complete len:311 (-),score=97.07 GFUD01003846.1:39-971(-)
MAVTGDFCVWGKTVIVTGGDKGLGLETCRQLLQGGARVILACRDQTLFGPEQEGGRQTLFRTLQCGNNKPEIMKVDLTSLQSVFDFCSQFRSQFSALDVLVCNAGVMTSSDNLTTQEGLELHMGVNHLAHFYMVKLLKDLLLKTSNARVVVVSSMLLKEGRIDIEGLGNPCSRTSNSKTPPAYADSKLMNAMFARELQAREPGLCVFCVSPGWCRTSLGRSSIIPWYVYPALLLVLAMFSRSAKQGADTIVFCAAGSSRVMDTMKGRFIRDRKVEESVEQLLHGSGRDGANLWEASEQLIENSMRKHNYS